MKNSDGKPLRQKQETAAYLMQMAQEMADMARNAAIPSLALLLDMAKDEALNFLAAMEKTERAAGLSAEMEKVTGAVRIMSARSGGYSGGRSGNHAAIVAQKAARKLKLHQPEIKA